MSDVLLIEEKGPIMIVKFNRPDKLNAFNDLIFDKLDVLINQVNRDDSVRAVIFTGAGRAFSSGRDISDLGTERLPSDFFTYLKGHHDLMDRLEHLSKPTIAAINGICCGGGLEWAISCDIRIASEKATFGLNENNLGLIPASGAASRMIQMVGIGPVKEMILTAEFISAEEAYRIGLVTHVVPHDELLIQAITMAEKLAQRAPVAMHVAKQVIWACQNTDVTTGRIIERLAQSVLSRTEDHKEGRSAFLSKRVPKFSGR